MLEALVALVMFGFITLAISQALSVALQTKGNADRHDADTGAVRAIFGVLTRDLQASYISMNNPASVFVTGTPSSAANGMGGITATGSTGGTSGLGQQNSSASGGANAAGNTILTLTTLSYRVLDEAAMGLPTGGTPDLGSTSQQQTVPAQSDCQVVRYDLDNETKTLTRTTADVPNLQFMSDATPDRDAIIARGIVSLTLSFWDTTQTTWRTDWDYEQQVNAANATASASGGATTASAPQTTTQTPDTMGPSMAKIDLTILGADGKPASYSTTVILAASLDTGSPPTNTNGTAGMQNGASTTGLGSR